MDIFSKRDGPRPEDVRARKHISQNAGTIRKLADQISNGGFTKMRQDQARRKEQPKPEGLLIYTMSAPARDDSPDPYVRLSLNGRVVLADRNTGRQIQLLGEIRNRAGSKHFVLASEENGYISPVSDELRDVLAQYDNTQIGPAFTEEDVVRTFGKCLGLTETRPLGSGGSDTQEIGGDTPEDDPSELL